MNETLDYIDSYFSGGFTAEQRQQFEQRIAADAAFAGEVAFYLQARQALQQQAVQQKENGWQGKPETAATGAPVVAMKKAAPLRRWMVAAAAVVVAAGIYVFTTVSGGGGATQMAQAYTDSAFETLSLSMGSQDSLQLGLDAYNQGRPDEAEKILEQVYTNHPDTLQALEYLGIISLKKKEYATALARFDALEKHRDLFSNPATFYKAITLLLRNSSGDKELARALLQQVAAAGNSENQEKAIQLLSHF